jgi:predicted small lipoprotein YifL
MKTTIAGIVSIMILLALQGCGGETTITEEYTPPENVPTHAQPYIHTMDEYDNKFNELKKLATKDTYESTYEYNTRINKFLEEQETITYSVDLYDSYDADTQILTVYDIWGGGPDFDFMFFSRIIEINNMEYFPYSVNSDNQLVLKRMHMSPEEAKEAHHSFYADIGIKFVKPFTYKSKIYNTDIDTYKVYGDMQSIKVYQQYKLIEEYSIN